MTVSLSIIVRVQSNFVETGLSRLVIVTHRTLWYEFIASIGAFNPLAQSEGTLMASSLLVIYERNCFAGYKLYSDWYLNAVRICSPLLYTKQGFKGFDGVRNFRWTRWRTASPEHIKLHVPTLDWIHYLPIRDIQGLTHALLKSGVATRPGWGVRWRYVKSVKVRSLQVFKSSSVQVRCSVDRRVIKLLDWRILRLSFFILVILHRVLAAKLYFRGNTKIARPVSL